MNILMTILMVISTSTAFAGQSIFCREITASGRLKANGGIIELNLEFNQNGTVSTARTRVEIKGFTQDSNDQALGLLKLQSANQSKESSDRAYTILFIGNDSDLHLDVQLQFNSRILKRNFNAEPGTLVIGSEDANPETGFAFGSRVICRSRI